MSNEAIKLFELDAKYLIRFYQLSLSPVNPTAASFATLCNAPAALQLNLNDWDSFAENSVVMCCRRWSFSR